MCYLLSFSFLLYDPAPPLVTSGRHPAGVPSTSSPGHSKGKKRNKKSKRTCLYPLHCATPISHPSPCPFTLSSYPPHVLLHCPWVRAAVHVDLSALGNTTTGAAAALLARSASCGQGPSAILAGELAHVSRNASFSSSPMIHHGIAKTFSNEQEGNQGVSAQARLYTLAVK